VEKNCCCIRSLEYRVSELEKEVAELKRAAAETTAEEMILEEIVNISREDTFFANPNGQIQSDSSCWALFSKRKGEEY
jgi:hypothetical protein